MTTSVSDSHDNKHDAMYCPKAQKILSAIARGEKLTRIDLSDCGLRSIPDAVFQLGECLELLNLGGNMISSLPDSMVVFKKLRILFFAQNTFTHIPRVLGKMTSLYMLSFKSNQLCMIDDESLSPSICWLILTDNDISELPSSIGKLTGLRKLMLAGNRITHLNEELQHCRELELVRLAANKLRVLSLPEWFWKLPKLSWLAIAGNLDNMDEKARTVTEESPSSISNLTAKTCLIEWTDLEVMDKLGEGASGIIYKAKWNRRDTKPIDAKSMSNMDNIVALKIFKGGKTSDGLPEDEMKASEAAGCHPCSLEVLGRTINAPDGQLGLVMPLIPSEFSILGGPPSFESVTRDTFEAGKSFSLEEILRILSGVSSVCAHLHGRGISHGDIYAHNILVTGQGEPLLSDFGASYFYTRASDIADNSVGSSAIPASIEAFEVRAFGCLMEDLLDRARDSGDEVCGSTESGVTERKRSITRIVYSDVIATLRTLQTACLTCNVMERPTFKSICAQLKELAIA